LLLTIYPHINCFHGQAVRNCWAGHGDKCVLGRKILLEAKGQGALQKTNFRVDSWLWRK